MLPPIETAVYAQGNTRLREEIEDAIYEVPSSILAYFFSITQERGRRLLSRFLRYRERYGWDRSFGEFVHYTIGSYPLAKAFLPRGCTNLQQKPVTKLLEKLNVLSRLQLLEAGITEIYFGRGEEYELVRNLCCRTCPVSSCIHKKKK